jgi:hypothetical protein
MTVTGPHFLGKGRVPVVAGAWHHNQRGVGSLSRPDGSGCPEVEEELLGEGQVGESTTGTNSKQGEPVSRPGANAPPAASGP